MVMRGEKVLVVDDDPAVIDTIQEILSRLGLQVSTAYRGLEALDSVRRGFFDLLLVDLKLPDMDGLEVVRQVRDLSPQTSFIMVTGFPSLESAARAVELNISSYLDKPFEIGQLVSAVTSALRKRRQG